MKWLRPSDWPVEWEPLDQMGPVQRFVANWTVFIAAVIALGVLWLWR